MKTLLLCAGLATGLAHGACAQAPLAGQPATDAEGLWADVGVGNGLGAHVGYFYHDWLLLGRTRYKWWSPDSPSKDGGEPNTKSRQTEVAALVGYSWPVSGSRVYTAAGLGYVAGRELGDYRYTTRQSGLITKATHYYSYRDYQALGVPLEVGVLFSSRYKHLGPGLSVQGNLNPEHSDFTVLLTFWVK